MSRTPRVIVHADDFGITPDQSRRILACSDRCGGVGALNSLSALVNAPRFSECAPLLDRHFDDMLVSLHVNLVEGPCVAQPERVSLLVDEAGVFKLSFGEMILLSLGPSKHELREQLEVEIGAQVERFLAYWPQERGRLRIDSHQHFHLIPMVFQAMLAAIASHGCTIEFMRVPAEPLAPFALEPSSIAGIPPINWVKHGVLNLLWGIDRASFPHRQRLSAVFCGICYSGCMTVEHVNPVIPAFKAYAESRAMPLELLFHPGALASAEEAMNPKLAGFTDFYLSENRIAEAYAIGHLSLDDRSELQATGAGWPNAGNLFGV